jgi:hypothetical protein
MKLSLPALKKKMIQNKVLKGVFLVGLGLTSWYACQFVNWLSQ